MRNKKSSWYVRYFSVPVGIYIMIMGLAVVLALWKVHDEQHMLLMQSIGCSLIASVIFAILTDIGTTQKTKKIEKAQYDSLVSRLELHSRELLGCVVGDDRQMPSELRILRTYSEWMDFFAKHYDDETLYAANTLDEIEKALGKIIDEATMLKKVAVLHFDHDMMDSFNSNRFGRVAVVSKQILDAFETDDTEKAFGLMQNELKKALLNVCPNAPLNQKVNCNCDI